MQIEQRPIQDIFPYDRNPRVNDQAVDAVAESIREFGVRQPIVVDTSCSVSDAHSQSLRKHARPLSIGYCVGRSLASRALSISSSGTSARIEA